MLKGQLLIAVDCICKIKELKKLRKVMQVCLTGYWMVFLLLAQAIAEESQSESKWKQLGELAMSAGKV